MTSPLPLGILVSGSGTNLQAIIDAIESGRVPAEVRLVVCNRPNAKALERTERHGIPCEIVDHRSFPNREAFDRARRRPAARSRRGAGVSGGLRPPALADVHRRLPRASPQHPPGAAAGVPRPSRPAPGARIRRAHRRRHRSHRRRKDRPRTDRHPSCSARLQRRLGGGPGGANPRRRAPHLSGSDLPVRRGTGTRRGAHACASSTKSRSPTVRW